MIFTSNVIFPVYNVFIKREYLNLNSNSRQLGGKYDGDEKAWPIQGKSHVDIYLVYVLT